MNLRPYQAELVSSIRNEFVHGTRSVLVTSPTGSGKTLLTAYMLKEAAARGKRCWFVVHRRELVRQSLRAFGAIGLEAGVISSGFPEEPALLVQVVSIGTVARRLKQCKPPDLIVWDECHHSAAGAWQAVRAEYSGAFHVGLTATPQRLDGKGLDDYFSKMLHGPSVPWLIDNGFLSPFKYYAPAGIDVTGVKTSRGDYDRRGLSLAADKPTVTGSAVKHYLRLCPGKRAIAFAVGVQHSMHIASEFNAAGIPAAHLDGDTPSDERDRTLAKFAEGSILVLSNVELFGEGFDVPGIEACLLLRPTQSLALHLQQVGRALRPAPGKEYAVILDHAGNATRHGMPDEIRPWTLEANDKKPSAKTQEVRCRVCPRCFGAQRPGAKACPYCGAAFEPTKREIEQVEGELKEIKKIEAKKEVGRARTLDDLVAIGVARGYSSPKLWALHILRARRGR